MFYLLQSMKLFCPKISEHKNMSRFILVGTILLKNVVKKW